MTSMGKVAATLWAAVGVTFAVEAAPLTITNPSFESPDVAVFADTTPTGWTVESMGNRDVLLQDGGGNLGTPPDGSQWLVLDSRDAGKLFQNIGTVDPDTIYTMAATVGVRSDLALPDDFEFGLWADPSPTPSSPANLLARLTKADLSLPTTAATPESELATLNFDSTGSTFVGQNLFVRLAIPSEDPVPIQQVLFDAVSVDATRAIIPEPASVAIWSLIGVCLTLFGYFRRRRRP